MLPWVKFGMVLDRSQETEKKEEETPAFTLAL